MIGGPVKPRSLCEAKFLQGGTSDQRERRPTMMHEICLLVTNDARLSNLNSRRDFHLADYRSPRIINIAYRSHVAAGSWFGKRKQMAGTIQQGSRFVVYSNDGALLRESLEQSFTQLRKRG